MPCMRYWGGSVQPDLEAQARAAALAAPLLLETETDAMRADGERRLTYRLPINLHFEINGEKRTASLVHHGQYRYEAEIDSRRFELDLTEIDGHGVRFSCDGVMESAVYYRDGARLLLRYRGQSFEIEDKTRAASTRQGTAGDSDGKLRAVMDGRVVAVLVAVGDRVEARQPIATIEAMKMEHVHEAPVSGIVTALNVSIDEQVPARRVIAEIQAGPVLAKD